MQIRSNEWNETLEQTIARSTAQAGLLAYSLVAGEVIEIDISGESLEGVVLDQSRRVTARAIGTRAGSLEVLEDSAREGNWQGLTVCFGSYAFSLAGMQFSSPGLLRGFIGHRQGVMVDLTGEHFVGATPPTQLMAEYETLHLEGRRIF